MKSATVYNLMTSGPENIKALLRAPCSGGKVFVIGVKGQDSYCLDRLERNFPFINIERLPEAVNRNYPNNPESHMLQPAFLSLKPEVVPAPKVEPETADTVAARRARLRAAGLTRAAALPDAQTWQPITRK